MMKVSKWDSVIDVALKGFYNITKPVIKKMVRKKKQNLWSAEGIEPPITRTQSGYITTILCRHHE